MSLSTLLKSYQDDGRPGHFKYSEEEYGVCGFTFCTNTYLVGIHWNCLNEAIPTSAHKIYFGA